MSAIGYTSAKSGLLPLITIIEQCIDDLNADELNQALIALEKLLFFEDSLSLSEKNTIVSSHIKFLTQLSHKIPLETPTSNNCRAGTYIRIISRLIILIFAED